MAPKLVLVILTGFLISKVTSSYLQPYSSIPYSIRDPRSSNPYQDYQAYYASYASKVAQPTYQRPAEVVASPPRPVEYRQPSYPRTPGPLPSTAQRPMEFRPPTYPAQVAPQTIQSAIEYRSPSYQKSPEYLSPVQIQPPIEYQSPSYQKAPEFIPPTIQNQRPVEYRTSPYQKPTEYITATIKPVEYRSAYQKLPEYVTPQTQSKSIEFPSSYQKAAEYMTPIIQSAMEFQSPSYQKTPESISPTVQIPLEYHQPAYQKVAEFIANQKPIEIQAPTCHTSDDSTSKCQSSLSPLTSSALESLQPLTLSKSDSVTPKSKSGTLDTDVLNNLAIALQLLIVNNIMNHPRSESIDSLSNLSDSILELAYPTELSVSNPLSVQTPCEMHNAKFLGGSNFSDDSLISKGMLGLGSIGTGFPLPRPGLNLMSPYDAIASSASSESSPSLFTLKNNFQSPYAAIMAADNNKDLFSMSDLF